MAYYQLYKARNSLKSALLFIHELMRNRNGQCQLEESC